MNGSSLTVVFSDELAENCEFTDAGKELQKKPES